MRSTSLALLAALPLLPCGALAQEPATAAPTWRIPIHAASAESGPSEPGLWAAGPTYKVRFERGFTVYPVLGNAYPENLPLTWTTQSIDVGGERWFAPADLEVRREVRHDDGWIEYRVKGLTERYDIVDGGVEQSFVLTRRPPSAGDLVIHGAIDTPLHADPRGPAHEPITFHGPKGEPVLRYGRAWAFDAGGRRVALATSIDALGIHVHVGAGFLASATYPVTIDPLTSVVTVNGGFGEVLDSDVCSAQPLAFTPTTHLAVYSRASSMSDVDAFGVEIDGNGGAVHTVWSDLSTTISTTRPRCGYLEPDWVIVWQSSSSRTSSAVRAYVQDRRVTSLNSGTTSTLSPPTGNAYARPDIGVDPTSFSLRCLAVFEEHSSGNTDVLGAYFYPLTNTFGTPFLIAGTPVGSTRERETPSVSTSIDLNDWIVCWSEHQTSGTDDWDVLVNLVDRYGSVMTPRLVGPSGVATEHARSPYVDGGHGRYIVTYSTNDTSTFSRRVGYQRVDWDTTNGTFSLGSERTLASAILLTSSVSQYGVAFDTDTTSHWAIVYRVDDSMRVARVGYTGGVTETATLAQITGGVGAGGVSHDGEDSLSRGRFLCTWGQVGTFSRPVNARFLTYPSGAFVSTFGDPPCGAYLQSSGHPYAGNGVFELIVSSVPSGAPLVLFGAATFVNPIPIPLASPCTLSLPLASLVVVDTAVAASSGTAFLRVPLPDDPLFQGAFYFQAAALEPGFNPLGISVSGGLGVHVQ